MQLNNIGKKVLTVAALTALLSACASDNDMSSSDDMSNRGMEQTDSSVSGPGAVGTDRVDSSQLDDAPAAGTQEDLIATAGERVHFAFDSHELSFQAKSILRKQAAWLKQHSMVSVTIEGHADERGTREYNLALGQRRSTAVRNFLIAEGISGNRITATTYGKERLLDPGQTEAAHAKNRRAVTVVQ